MKHDKATKLAIECIEKEMRRLAIEANMADLVGARYPAAVKASERRRELRDAVEALREPIQSRMGL